jgi:hypothetical protein
MARVSRIEGRLSNDVLCLLQRMSPFMAHRDIQRSASSCPFSGLKQKSLERARPTRLTLVV